MGLILSLFGWLLVRALPLLFNVFRPGRTLYVGWTYQDPMRADSKGGMREQEQPAELFSRKRKPDVDVLTRPHAKSKPKLDAHTPKPAKSAALPVRKSAVAEEAHLAASKGGKGAGKSKGNGPIQSSQPLEHARSKIEELVRQLEESQERTLIAVHQVDDYNKAAESRDGLEKKLVAHRFVASRVHRASGVKALQPVETLPPLVVWHLGSFSGTWVEGFHKYRLANDGN